MGTDEDEIIKGINNYFRKIAEKQIRIAFEQAEKELDDLHQRTREGIETARLAGKQIGQLPGRKLNVKKDDTAKEIIKLHSRDYGGNLRDTLYKKIKELREELLHQDPEVSEKK